MKVVITHTDFRIYWVDRLKALSSYLLKKNIELFIIEIASDGSHYDFAETNSNIPLNWFCLFPGQKIEDLPPSLISKVLQNKINEINPEIVIAGAIAFPSGAGALKWKANTDKPIIIFDDARLQDIQRGKIVNFVKKKLFTSVDAVIVPNKLEWESTYTFFGLTPYQLFDGIDVVNNSFFSRVTQETPGEILPRNSILAVGRQIPIKNWISLLDAWIAINMHQTIQPYHLVFIGEGIDQVLLCQKATDSKLKNIHFFPFQSQELIKKMFHSAKCLVLPSYRETWGLVVNEAMASRLPVLVSNQCGCATTLVKEGQNGYTFNPESIIEIEKTLLAFISLSEAHQEAMGNESLKIINEWGLDRFCNGVFEAIQYVKSNKKKTDLLCRLISAFWDGRYRPI